MKFLVLAYGDEKDWVKLSEREQQALLAQDQVLLKRGDTVASVQKNVTTVRNPDWSPKPNVSSEPFAPLPVPLAGYGIIETRDLDEAIALVAQSPCAVAGGAVELRQID
jgi:hypothetical protein